MMASDTPHVGTLLRDWRQRRRYSQLDLALEAEISQRHLSFVESGRAQPSRQMLLHLAEHLDIPLRDRNALLLAAGFAPVYPQRPADEHGSAELQQAIRLVLDGHAPNPALVVDGRWNLAAANPPAELFLRGVDAALLVPPINMIRVSLDPRGLAPRIRNLADWRRHIVERLKRQLRMTGDQAIADLLTQIQQLPRIGSEDGAHAPPDPMALVLPFEVETEVGLVSMIATTTVFGTAVEVMLSELTLETFYPADATSAARLRQMVQQAAS